VSEPAEVDSADDVPGRSVDPLGYLEFDDGSGFLPEQPSELTSEPVVAIATGLEALAEKLPADIESVGAIPKSCGCV